MSETVLCDVYALYSAAWMLAIDSPIDRPPSMIDTVDPLSPRAMATIAMSPSARRYAAELMRMPYSH